MNRRGIGITVDVLFSLLLVSGVLLLFSSQPFVDPPSSSTFPLAASARDALGVLDKSGALSAQLVNRAFAADGVKAIHDAVLRLMPSDLNLKIRVTRFELADDLTDCDDLTAAGFDRCFPQSKRVSFEYAPETVVPETGFSHGRLSFVKYLPRPDIGSPSATKSWTQVIPPQRSMRGSPTWRITPWGMSCASSQLDDSSRAMTRPPTRLSVTVPCKPVNQLTRWIPKSNGLPDNWHSGQLQPSG
jgi:hypothetical protein